MKRITLTVLSFTLTGGTAVAQTPVVPAAPTPPTAPSAATAPMSPIAPRFGIRAARPVRDFDDMRELMAADREALRADQLQTSRAQLQASREALRGQEQELRAEDAIMRAQAGAMDAFRFRGSEGFDYRLPPAPWAQGDPADSLYRVARNSLSSGEYGRAAKLFSDIAHNFPKSAYASDASYYEALARYKIGTTDELKQAAKLLEPIASKNAGTGSTNVGFYGARRGSSRAEVSALYLRINGVLAQRGDRDAADIVSKAAAQPGAPCDQDDLEVRTQALNALSQMDPGAAVPIIRRVLDRKDECSAPLRRNAVFMLARRGDNESTSLLLQEAKSDPNVSVRTEAISFLSRVPGDVGINALEEMLRTEQDETIQRAAVRALASSDDPKARASMRTLIDRKDAAPGLRAEAIRAFNSERSTPDDAKYLRDLYGRADNEQVKLAIIDALARIGGAENEQWVLGIATNANEPSAMRAAALGRLARSQTVSIASLSKLYDNAESYELRRQVINLLAMRKEPEATDKLIDIVKNSTVPPLRSQAINALTRKNDPRSTQLLMDILDGKRP